jgi:hypothetical protein
MKHLFVLMILALGFVLAGSAQTQPGVYGVELVSGNTHMTLWLDNPVQMAGVPGIVGAVPGETSDTLIVSVRSDNPLTTGFYVTVVYQLSGKTFTKSLWMPSVPDGQFAKQWLSITGGTPILLAVNVAEIPPTAVFQFQK